MSGTAKRIIVALGMGAVVLIAAWLERAGINAVFWLCALVGAAMIAEFARCIWNAPRDVMFNARNVLIFLLFFGLLVLDFVSLLRIGHRPMLVLLILLTVCAADIGAWFFGGLIGGDKLWEKISQHKTWAGQIFGIICGTVTAVLYGYTVLNGLVPQLLWIGISVSLLSQYGDLTASFVKRKLGIKDFSNILSEHGGVIDRFDGWIYVLPLVWMLLVR